MAGQIKPKYISPEMATDAEVTVEIEAVEAAQVIANTADRDRANHTGTQLASTISDIETIIAANTDVVANTAKISADGSIDTHSDVDTTTVTPTNGQVLAFNTGAWAPATLPSATDWTIDQGATNINDNNVPHTSVVTGNPHAVTQTEVGLGNVDNTSDVNKPVSTAQQTALDLKTDLTTFNDHDTRHLPGGADPLPTAVASNLTPDLTAAIGTAESFSRSDHIHNILTATASTISGDSANAQGAAASFSRSDHLHNILTGNVSQQTPDQANAEGVSPNLARADHIHNIPAAVAVTSATTSTSAEGVSSSFSRADHVHKIEIGRSVVNSSAGTTTSSATLVTLLTTTPVAGTYVVRASCVFNRSSNGSIATFQIFSGGTGVADTSAAIAGRNPETHTYTSAAEITVNGSQAVDIRWAIDAGSITNDNCSIDLIRVA